MIDFKKVKTETTAITRQKDQFYAGTGNIYETVAILSKRANQIAAEEKQELRITGDLPLLEITQVAFLDDGRPFEYSISRHRGDWNSFRSVSIR